ncbi:MAG: hypothetical protein ACE5H4_03735 [Candidatus Thorarchaeota archaeon]
MRNLLGGLVGALVGAWLLVTLLALEPTSYPAPFDSVWILLDGAAELQQVIRHILNSATVGAYLVSWLVVGIVTGLFSKSSWNAVRTSVWAGIVMFLLALTSNLVLDPLFWTSPNRNWDLVFLFASSIIIAGLSLPSSVPTVRIVNILQRGKTLPPPGKIQTVCECGAVFKSRPLLCSNCGRRLAESK